MTQQALVKHTSITHQASSMCAWCVLGECSTSYAIAVYTLEPAWRL